MSPLASMLEGIDDVEKGFAKKASGRKAFRILDKSKSVQGDTSGR